QRGLAGADLAGQLHETAAATLADAVQQVRERVPVALAQENVARIGGDREGRLFEAVELKIHSVTLPRTGVKVRGQRRKGLQLHDRTREARLTVDYFVVTFYICSPGRTASVAATLSNTVTILSVPMRFSTGPW